MEDVNVAVGLSRLTHSPGIGQLGSALAKARKKFKVVRKDSQNPFYKSKYADLATVIAAMVDALADEEIAVVQSPSVSGDAALITTLLIHSSGEWVRDELPLPMTKFDAQGAGSAFTYGRRYALSAFMNVAAEEDDDGQAAVGPVKELPKPPAKKVATQPKPAVEDAAPTFSKLFWAKAKAAGKTETAVREYIGSIGYEHTTEIPPSAQQNALKWADGTL